MVRLEALIDLFAMDDEQAWAAALARIAGQLGFSHILFGLVPDRTVPLENAFLVSNYPAQWRADYDAQRMHAIDPTVRHCLASVLPIVWQPATFSASREQHQFYEQAAAYGLRSGISFPLHGNQGEFGVMSFVADDRQHAGSRSCVEELAALTLVRDYALESSRRFLAPRATPVRLTARELEVLKWVTAGKSSWEVSRILGRSEATVNFHMGNIMRKFDVPTRQQAVVRAIRDGLVLPS
jgi:LuxR family transcriptional regulator, quorum-sensing system regulator LasR